VDTPSRRARCTSAASESRGPRRHIPCHRAFPGCGRNRRHTVFVGARAIPEADAGTFVLLGDRYSKDAHRVYFEHHTLDGADSATFEVVQGKAADRFRVYDGRQSTERLASPDPRASPGALETVARRLTEKRIQVLFPVFDTVQSNDSSPF
jgi:hypothetical protein